MKALRSLAAKLFGLDTRSLALFRVAFGALVVLDVLNRLPDLGAHYTDAGAVPRQAVAEHLRQNGYVSLHLVSGGASWILFLFLVELGFGALLLVGFRTRLATIVCWLLTVSLHNRNLLVLNAGDTTMRLMLFWAMFLPLGARWSVDARHSGTPPPTTYLGVASAGLVTQLAFVYLFAWALKTGAAWQDGSAIYYALQIDHFAKPLAHLLLPHRELLAFLTRLTMVFEFSAPLLLFFPFFQGPLRTAVVLGIVGMHLAFFATMELGLFPWVCMAAWTAVLPAWFWDRLGVRASNGPSVGERDWVGALASVALMMVAWWNLSTVAPDWFAMPGPVATAVRAVRLDQRWKMFAPSPMKDDGWFVIVGRFRDGSERDLLRGGPVTFDKPEGIARSYPGQRWAKYMRNLWHKKHKPMRRYYGRYLCRRSNAGTTGALDRLEMFFMKEVTPPPGAPDPLPERVALWKQHCSDDAVSR